MSASLRGFENPLWAIGRNKIKKVKNGYDEAAFWKCMGD
jgi:hypothetical protein